MFERKYLMLSGFLALCPLIPLRAMDKAVVLTEMDFPVARVLSDDIFKKTVSKSTVKAMDIPVAPPTKELAFIKKTLSQSTACKLEIVDMIPTDESTIKRRIDDYMNLAMKFYNLKVHELQSHPRNMTEVNSLYNSCSDFIFAGIYLGSKIGMSRAEVVALFGKKTAND